MSTPVNHLRSRKVDRPLARLLQRLWPSRCLVCRETPIGGSELCNRCLDALPWNRTACTRCATALAHADHRCGNCLQEDGIISETTAVFIYRFPIDRLLPRFKFHHDLAAGRLASELMLPVLANAPRPDALVPIPLHPSRLRERGYDQALELARPLARSLGLPLSNALRRNRATPPQSQLDADARKRNLRNAFSARTSGCTAPLPAHVALIDDVMTTGSTLTSAGQALKRAGVQRIDAWVCARVC